MHGFRDIEGLEGDFDADFCRIPLIPGLQAPRYFIADTEASSHIIGSRHAPYDFEPTDPYAIRAVNDSSMIVIGAGKLYFHSRPTENCLS